MINSRQMLGFLILLCWMVVVEGNGTLITTTGSMVHDNKTWSSTFTSRPPTGNTHNPMPSDTTTDSHVVTGANDPLPTYTTTDTSSDILSTHDLSTDITTGTPDGAGTHDPLPTDITTGTQDVVGTHDPLPTDIRTGTPDVAGTHGPLPTDMTTGTTDVTGTYDPLPTDMTTGTPDVIGTYDPLPTDMTTGTPDVTGTHDPLPTYITTGRSNGPGTHEPIHTDATNNSNVITTDSPMSTEEELNKVHCAWAIAVTNASTENSDSSNNFWWNTEGMLGPPEFFPCYDDNIASNAETPSNVFVELLYDIKLFIHQVLIYETKGAGSVIQISTFKPATGEMVVLWSEEDPADFMDCSRVFAPPLKFSSFKSNRIRLDIDASVIDVVEIDAVQIYGRIDQHVGVRLVSEEQIPLEGRLEVYESGKWGTVCDDRWDDADANVVCYQLGFGPVADMDMTVYGDGPIHMDEVNCDGTENRLQDCQYIDQHDCWHSEDVGLFCDSDTSLPPCMDAVGSSGCSCSSPVVGHGFVRKCSSNLCDFYEPWLLDVSSSSDASSSSDELSYSGASSYSDASSYSHASSSLSFSSLENFGSSITKMNPPLPPNPGQNDEVEDNVEDDIEDDVEDEVFCRDLACRHQVTAVSILPIPIDTIKASSHKDTFSPDQAFLCLTTSDNDTLVTVDLIEDCPMIGTYLGWCATRSDEQQWLEATFVRRVTIVHLITFGVENGAARVTHFSVSYTKNNGYWRYYTYPGTATRQIFDGNNVSADAENHVIFDAVFEAQSVRFHPLHWILQICMRIEIIGYYVSDPGPLGMADGSIADSQISASGNLAPVFASWKGRLNETSAWCADTEEDERRFFKVDLLVPMEITGIQIQGRRPYHNDTIGWEKAGITECDISFSLYNMKDAWIGHQTLFRGNVSHDTKVTLDLETPVISRFVLLSDFSWSNKLCIRIEILGRTNVESLFFANFHDEILLDNVDIGVDGFWQLSAVTPVPAKWIDIYIGANGSFVYFDSPAVGTGENCSNSSIDQCSWESWSSTSHSHDQGYDVAVIFTYEIDPVDHGLATFKYLLAAESTESSESTEWPFLAIYIYNGHGSELIWELSAQDNATAWYNGTFVFSFNIPSKFFVEAGIPRNKTAIVAFDEFHVIRGISEPNHERTMEVIADDQLSASSVRSLESEAEDFVSVANGIDSVTGATVWCAAENDTQPWIQIDFEGQAVLAGVITQGRHTYGEWVSEYRIELYSWDGDTLLHQFTEIFTGNYDDNTTLATYFPFQVSPTKIRILPQQWVGSSPCMSIDILGYLGHLYLGCFYGLEDQELPDNVKYSNLMTNEKCFKHCRQLGMNLAGIQDGSKCLCGNDTNFEARPDSECGYSCPGDLTQKCGGDLRMSGFSLRGLSTDQASNEINTDSMPDTDLFGATTENSYFHPNTTNKILTVPFTSSTVIHGQTATSPDRLSYNAQTTEDDTTFSSTSEANNYSMDTESSTSTNQLSNASGTTTKSFNSNRDVTTDSEEFNNDNVHEETSGDHVIEHVTTMNSEHSTTRMHKIILTSNEGSNHDLTTDSSDNLHEETSQNYEIEQFTTINGEHSTTEISEIILTSNESSNHDLATDSSDNLHGETSEDHEIEQFTTMNGEHSAPEMHEIIFTSNEGSTMDTVTSEENFTPTSEQNLTQMLTEMPVIPGDITAVETLSTLDSTTIKYNTTVGNMATESYETTGPMESPSTTIMSQTTLSPVEIEVNELIQEANNINDVLNAVSVLNGSLSSETTEAVLATVQSISQDKTISVEDASALQQTLTSTSDVAAQSQRTAEVYLSVCNNLLSVNNTQAINGESQSQNRNSNTTQRSSGTSNLMKTIENFAVNLGSNVLTENKTQVTINNENLVVKVQAVSVGTSLESDSISVDVNDSSSAVSLPTSSLGGKTVQVTTVVYKTLHSAVSSTLEGYDNDNSTSVASKVLSISVTADDGSNLTFSTNQPIVLTFQLVQAKSADQTPRCTFWKFDESDDSGGIWSTTGCSVNSSYSQSTVCHCTHLTNFAVLMQVNPNAKPIPATHSLALDTLTYLGTSLSITALGCTILTFVVLKMFKSQRTSIHANLAVALGSAQLLYLIGIDETGKQMLCTLLAVLLHYLFTASICWMGLEGLHLYTCTKSTGVFGKRFKTRVWMAIGWGVPAVIVTISTAIRPQGYGTETSCWLSVEQGLAWAFVVPVIFVVMMNSVVLVLVIRVFITLKANADKSEKERLRIGLRAVLMLQPLLGLTWLFGLLAAYDSTLLFAYLFVILNSSQGIFIFLLHCAGDNEVKKAFRRKYRLVRRRSTITSMSMDTSSSTVTSNADTKTTQEPFEHPTLKNFNVKNTPHVTETALNQYRLKKRTSSASSVSKTAWEDDSKQTKSSITANTYPSIRAPPSTPEIYSKASLSEVQVGYEAAEKLDVLLLKEDQSIPQ